MNKKGFVSLLGLLIALIIIILLWHLALKTYGIKSASEKNQSVSSSNPKTTIDTAREVVDTLNRQQSERMKTEE